ncbi:hypothetical protein CJF31_00002457 [Rutstroemia sp. NJR-2017a BVV2]|nr:hypothetical protein CJF31_00002457 [Rutstroemia sp. NJR-2017a BVV2]
MATEFTKFPALPPELRRRIWRFCMPEGRVLEFDYPHPYIIATKCTVGITSKVNARPPSITRVCHESRDVAFTEGGFLSDVQARLKARGVREPEMWYKYGYTIQQMDDPWFCPKTDTVHLHWDVGYDGIFGTDCHQVPALVAHARAAQGGSIRADLLLSFEKEYSTFLDKPHRLDYYGWPIEGLPPVERLDGFKVCLSIINIHTTDARVIESGLFGGLETPIQLVDASDRKTIRRMYQLWWTTFEDNPKLKDPEPEELFEEMILTPDDFEARVRRWHEEIELRWLWRRRWHGKSRYGVPHPIEAIDSPQDVFTGPKIDRKGNVVTGLDQSQIRMPEHAFNKEHPWVQDVLQEMPRFQAMIMFRYCAAKCYAMGRPEVPKDWGANSDTLGSYDNPDWEMERLFRKNPFTFDPASYSKSPPSTESP